MSRKRQGGKTVVSSLRVLLTGIIDYAGLFPPARLPLDRAIQAYALPAKSVPLDARPLPLSRRTTCGVGAGHSGVIRPGTSFTDCRARTRWQKLRNSWPGCADVEAIGAFRDCLAERTEVGVYEGRVPGEVLAAGSGGLVGNLLHDVARVFEETSLPSITAYYEAASGVPWRSSVALLNAALAMDNRQRADRERRAGWAGRTQAAPRRPRSRGLSLAGARCLCHHRLP